MLNTILKPIAMRKLLDREDVYFTSGKNVNVDAEYNLWLNELKNRFYQAQIRATVRVNAEKLRWNWELGRDLMVRKAEERWGTGIVEQLSLDLRAAFPNEKGFGASNLWYMKKWYSFYSEKLHQAGGELQEKLHQASGELQRGLSVDGLDFPDIFALVPWRHHVEIITHCDTIEQAFFYINKTIESGLSRSELINSIKANLFLTQGGAITNFTNQLPMTQAECAQEMTKENYDFGFITLPPKYKEAQLEEALCQQMTRFLLELGTGFSFVGRQKEIVVHGTSRRIDLLFYHIHLRCYIVVELKVVPFAPEFVGKINYYVSAVDELLKTDNDNPTIGLLICSDMNQTDVQWAFRGVATPIGVASYTNVQIEEIKKQLPTIEQLQERIKLLEMELKSSSKNNK